MPPRLLQTLLMVAAASAVTLFLARRTRFRREFAYILRLCLTSESAIKVLPPTTAMIALLLTEVRLNVLSTFTSKGLYDPMQDLNASAFWMFAVMSAGVVLIRAFNSIVNDLLDRGLAIKWPERLNEVLTTRWLADENCYRLQTRRHAPGNIDQRIQQDVRNFIASTIEFVRGTVNSVITSLEFAVVLWGLADILAVFDFDIPHDIVWFVYMFVILAASIAMWIGNPLIRYNYENEKLNGDYRYSLVRVRDHVGSVAFCNGEEHERDQLADRFKAIIRSRWRIIHQSACLSGPNDMFTNGIKLFPIILQAPRLFAGQIKIGDIRQTVQAFARLQNTLSFFRMFYNKFAAYRARLERLYGFLLSTEEQHSAQQPDIIEASDDLPLESVALSRHNGEVLLGGINVNPRSGDSLLIRGPNGYGKTSLLRALAGLWPLGNSGRVSRPPHQDILSLPRRPYTAQSSLRDAIYYPNIDKQHPELAEAMNACRLDYLINKLGKADDWQYEFSLDELQRVAFVRVLLSQSKVILLDEATAASDEPTEASLYHALKQKLSQSIIISIDRRSTLGEFRNFQLDVGNVACD